MLIDGEHYPDVSWGVKLVHGNVGFDRGVLTLPQWSSFLVPRLVKDFHASSLPEECVKG